MPLKSGSGKSIVGFNIKELVDSGKAKGSIGNGPPKSGLALQKQAVAIALSKAGKSNKDKGKAKPKPATPPHNLTF